MQVVAELEVECLRGRKVMWVGRTVESHNSNRVSITFALQNDEGMIYESVFMVPFPEISGAQVLLNAETSQTSTNKVRTNANIENAC